MASGLEKFLEVVSNRSPGRLTVTEVCGGNGAVGRYFCSKMPEQIHEWRNYDTEPGVVDFPRYKAIKVPVQQPPWEVLDLLTSEVVVSIDHMQRLDAHDLARFILSLQEAPFVYVQMAGVPEATWVRLTNAMNRCGFHTAMAGAQKIKDKTVIWKGFIRTGAAPTEESATAELNLDHRQAAPLPPPPAPAPQPKKKVTPRRRKKSKRGTSV